MKNLKLFIWTDLNRDYIPGLAFAIAKDESEAKQLITKQRGYKVFNWGKLEIKELTKKVARSVSGG